MTSRPRPGIGPHELRADTDGDVEVVRLGTVPYQRAWDLQRSLVEQRRAGQRRDLLLLLEHPAVYTLGKRTDPAHLRYDAAERAEHGIELVEVDRGGDITYHGPGQLVGYPIWRLASIRGVVDYVRALEELLIRTLERFDIAAERSEGYTGVWVGDEKIAAIGVRVASGGITSHGFALNVTTRMEDFLGIVPCGIADREVTSLERLGVRTTVDEVADAVVATAADLFTATLVEAAADTLTPSMEPTS